MAAVRGRATDELEEKVYSTRASNERYRSREVVTTRVRLTYVRVCMWDHDCDADGQGLCNIVQ